MLDENGQQLPHGVTGETVTFQFGTLVGSQHADAMRNKPNLHRFDGEFNVLWYETVLAICERPDVEIFGITRHSEFFIISSLSAGYGYRTVRSTTYSDYVVWHLTTATRFDATV